MRPPHCAAGNITGGSGYNFGATYALGPVAVAAAYEYFQNPTGAGGTGFFTDNANGASQLSGVLNSGYATASSYQVLTAGGTFTAGRAIFGATWSHTQYGHIGTLAGSTAKFNTAEAGFKFQFTPAFYTGGGYSYTKGDAVNNGAGGSVGN